MAAAARRMRTPISTLRETPRRSPWAQRPNAEVSPVGELWARIEREYARTPLSGAASTD